MTDEIDVQTKLEAVKINNKAQTKVEEEIDIDLKDPEVDKAALKIQASFRGQMARKEVRALKAESFVGGEEETLLDWSDSELDIMATQVQAGYRGMKVREEVKEETELEMKAATLKGKQIEERLGIDLQDPSVVSAATLIQAGFRGAITRKNIKTGDSTKPPEIIVEETPEAESESEYTYTYEDEDDESESLKDRPVSPLTAIENNRQEFSIAGFKASALITTWLQRRRRLRPLTEADKDIVASRIQAGYKGMITREQQKIEGDEKEDAELFQASPFRIAGKVAVLATRRKVPKYPLKLR